MTQIDPKAQIAVLQQAIKSLKTAPYDASGNKQYAIGLLEGMVFVLETQVDNKTTKGLCEFEANSDKVISTFIPETPTIIE